MRLLRECNTSFRLGEMSTNHIYEKGFVSRIYKELSGFKKRNNVIEKWTKDSSRYFIKENTWM